MGIVYDSGMEKEAHHIHSPTLPDWVECYQPRYLKQPRDGRIFQVPRKKAAMRDARLILSRLRRESQGLSSVEQTEYVLTVLRGICPFIFEELLLHCCADLGWKVKRSCYTHDGGIDGIFWDEDGYKFLLQAKRYKKEINPDHVLAFAAVVKDDREATGGILMHTGLTCEISRELNEQLTHTDILEGCGLREFILLQ